MIIEPGSGFLNNMSIATKQRVAVTKNKTLFHRKKHNAGCCCCHEFKAPGIYWSEIQSHQLERALLSAGLAPRRAQIFINVLKQCFLNFFYHAFPPQPPPWHFNNVLTCSNAGETGNRSWISLKRHYQETCTAFLFMLKAENNCCTRFFFFNFCLILAFSFFFLLITGLFSSSKPLKRRKRTINVIICRRMQAVKRDSKETHSLF